MVNTFSQPSKIPKVATCHFTHHTQTAMIEKKNNLVNAADEVAKWLSNEQKVYLSSQSLLRPHYLNYALLR